MSTAGLTDIAFTWPHPLEILEFLFHMIALITLGYYVSL